jgi:hypothetical protein
LSLGHFSAGVDLNFNGAGIHSVDGSRVRFCKHGFVFNLVNQFIPALVKAPDICLN